MKLTPPRISATVLLAALLATEPVASQAPQQPPALGRTPTLGSPIKMSETPPLVRRRAPGLGERTDEVLREAGFSEEEVRRIRA